MTTGGSGVIMPESYSAQLKPVLIKLDKQVSRETASKMLDVIVLAQEEDFAKPAPKWDANSPPGTRGNGVWYKRRVGTKTPTRQYTSSEDSRVKWKATKKGAFKRTFENTASYIGWIMGNKQVGWAKTAGWLKMPEELPKRAPKYAKIAARVIAKVNKS